jgi:hypothetical protein
MHKTRSDTDQSQAVQSKSVMHETQKPVITKNTSEGPQTHTQQRKSVITKTQKSVTTKNTLEAPQTHIGQGKSVATKNQTTRRKRGRPELTEDDLPDSLKELLDYDFYLDVGNEYKNAKILSERTCVSIITYYAQDAEERRKQAKQTSRQFQLFGLRGWVHSITGWEAPKPIPHEQLTRAEKLGIDPRHKEVTLDRHAIYNTLLNKGINASMYRVYLYLIDCDLVQHRPDLPEICRHTHVPKRSLYDLVERMRDYGLVPEWLGLDASSRSLEAQIRDRLQAELGGEVEVQTIHGPIDLLTPTTLIEIKRIEDWKTGFGQIMAKAPAYPKHKKRLHLFGNSDRTLRNITACCQEFEISVDYESVALQLI